MFNKILDGLPPFLRVFVAQLVPLPVREKINEMADLILSDVANDRADDLLVRVRELLDYGKIDYQHYRDQ